MTSVRICVTYRSQGRWGPAQLMVEDANTYEQPGLYTVQMPANVSRDGGMSFVTLPRRRG